MKDLNFNRRTLLQTMTALSAGSMFGPAFAQTNWPGKQISFVVPFPPGGPTDTASRILAQELSEQINRPVIVDNRSGASGTIGASYTARSKSDGNTLMMLATPTLLASHLYPSVRYDILKDFVPVAVVYDLPIVIVVNPDMLPDVTDLPSLMETAKDSKTPLNYTSAGIGSFGHLSMELLKQMGDFEMQHIPYNGTIPAITDTLAGEVPVMYADLVGALPHVQSGKLRAIAVGSPERVHIIPDVKTIAEQGIEGYDAVSWGGILAPAGLSADVTETISQKVKNILADDEIKKKMLGAGAIVNYQSPDQMKDRLENDFSRWGQVIRDKGITQQ